MNNQITKSNSHLYWMFLYIVLSLIGWKLAGIGGSIGGIFISFGLNKVIRNPNYSKNKKILYSILYSIGGIIMALVIVFILIFAIQYYFPNALKESNIESTYQIPAGFSKYKNNNMQISSLAYPNGWIITEGKRDEFKVIFQSPNNISNITLSLFFLGEGETMDYKKFLEEAQKILEDEPRFTFKKIVEETKNINNKEWATLDFILGIKNKDNLHYNKIALLKTGKYENRQFYQFLLESDKDHFVEDAKILDKIIESLRFYN